MPTYRPTNSGLQTKGTLLAGFDPATSAVVAGVFMVSIMVTFAAISVLKVAWFVALPVCFLIPNAALLSVIFFLIMGKPPGYLRDWLESRVFGWTGVDLTSLPEPPSFET